MEIEAAPEPGAMVPASAGGTEADVTDPSAESTAGLEETAKDVVSPDEFANVHSDFWQEFGQGMLTLPAPAAPKDDAHLVVARQTLALRLPDLDGGPARTVMATLTFYEIQNDLQMQLEFTEPLSYRYRGVTGPQQVEISIPGTEITQARRFPVERCGLISVLAMNAEGSTRLVFSFTPAGSFDLLSGIGAPTLYAHVHKGPGLPRRETLAKADYAVKATQIGMASWYGPGFHGRRTASGERFNMNADTAAHRTLPMGTKARVTNLQNGKSTVVQINDRGPFRRRRIIDVSRGVADRLGFRRRGTARVKVEVLEPDKGKK
jgi:hypothetical protein